MVALGFIASCVSSAGLNERFQTLTLSSIVSSSWFSFLMAVLISLEGFACSVLSIVWLDLLLDGHDSLLFFTEEFSFSLPALAGWLCALPKNVVTESLLMGFCREEEEANKVTYILWDVSYPFRWLGSEWLYRSSRMISRF